MYYLEQGMDKRPSRVVYDRKNSAFAEAEADESDLDNILAGADYFHVSGITPALSDTCLALTLSALKAAKKQGVFGCSYFWTIKELFEQRERVKKGCFPKTPNRKD